SSLLGSASGRAPCRPPQRRRSDEVSSLCFPSTCAGPSRAVRSCVDLRSAPETENLPRLLGGGELGADVVENAHRLLAQSGVARRQLALAQIDVVLHADAHV